MLQDGWLQVVGYRLLGSCRLQDVGWLQVAGLDVAGCRIDVAGLLVGGLVVAGCRVVAGKIGW